MTTGYLSKLTPGQRRAFAGVTLAALAVTLFGLSREFVAEEHAAAAFDAWTIPATIVGALVVSFVMYRPFCQLTCPFGFVSWFAERVSLTRVRVDHAKCTQCGACVRACPTTATQGLVDGKVFSADCFSCGRCLNVCPEDAIGYGLVLSRRPEAGQPGQAVRSP